LASGAPHVWRLLTCEFRSREFVSFLEFPFVQYSGRTSLQLCPHYLRLERSVVAQEAGRALTLPGPLAKGCRP
jgi:hypothetical protein